MDEPIRPKSAAEQAADLTRYERLLDAHDWFYEFSEDPQAVRVGRAERALLREMQATLDPDHVVWDQHAPALFMYRPPHPDGPQS